MSSAVHSVQRDENQLKKKEADLEKKEKKLEQKNAENGNGDLDGFHQIHMTPLMPHMNDMSDMFSGMGSPHVEIIPLNGPPMGMMNHMGGLGDLLKSLGHRTGPASEHHMGPFMPFGNLFRPGAHPAHAPKTDENTDKKNTEVKKDEPKKDDTKMAEPKKDDAKKEESKPKPDEEKGQV